MKNGYKIVDYKCSNIKVELNHLTGTLTFCREFVAKRAMFEHLNGMYNKEMTV